MIVSEYKNDHASVGCSVVLQEDDFGRSDRPDLRDLCMKMMFARSNPKCVEFSFGKNVFVR